MTNREEIVLSFFRIMEKLNTTDFKCNISIYKTDSINILVSCEKDGFMVNKHFSCKFNDEFVGYGRDLTYKQVLSELENIYLKQKINLIS